MHRSFLKALLYAAGAVVLAVPASAADAVKIGVTQPLTGAFAADGNYVAQGAKLAAEAINKAGGVDGKQIELVVEDNKSNPTGHCHINRFYCSLLASPLDSDAINSMT